MGRREVLGGVVCAAVCAGLLAGCGAETGSTKAITKAQTPATEETEAPMQAETAAQEAAAEPSTGDTQVEEQVLLDADGVKITARGYTKDAIYGDGIPLLIENSGSKSVGIGCDALIVNHYMLTNLFSAEVAAGKKSNETLYLSSSEREACGIDNVGEVEAYFHLYDPDTYETTYTAERADIKTNHYENMDTSPNDGGTELVNENGIRIVGKYVDENSFWGNAVVLYLENNTDKNVEIQCDDMSVNGYMMTPYFSSTVYAHRMAVDDITLMQSELDENGISGVEDVELTFHVLDADTFETIFDTDPVSFQTK